MYKQYHVVIGGNILLMHNSQTADPLNKYAKAMKQFPRKKTEADLYAMARIEYEAGLYLNSKGEVVIPSRLLEANIVSGARVQKDGKTALAGLFVDTDAIFTYEGGPLSVQQLLDSDEHRLTVPVTVNQSKIMRTRPQFKNWEADFTVSIDENLVNESQLKKWLDNAGGTKGLGDWRPRYGRYLVKKFESVKSDLAW